MWELNSSDCIIILGKGLFMRLALLFTDTHPREFSEQNVLHDISGMIENVIHLTLQAHATSRKITANL